MSFGWAIVSTGKHPDVKIAPAMAVADGAELVGVYSRDRYRAEAFAQKHGARAAYSQLGDLFKDARVDGVFVASPNALHAEHVVQAAEAGKHVLCEKPMATTIADAVRMLTACRRAGVTLGVISNWDHTLDSILSKKGLGHFFKVVVASTTFGEAKPSKKIFQHALSLAGAQPSEAWHVGDDPDADALGAVRAGLHAVLLDPHGLYASLEARGVVRASNLSEAVDRILG